MLAHRNGSYSEANGFLNSAVATRPKDPVLREHLADTLIQQNNYEAAISQLSQATALSGDDARLCAKLGRIYLQTGRWLAATQYARKALEADRTSAEAWALLAETKLVKGELSESLSDFQRALSHRREYPGVQLKVAQIQQLLGRPMRAFSTVEQLLQQTPVSEQSEEALLLAGNLLVELKQPAQAIEKLQIAAARQQASEACFVALSEAQISLGQPSQARNTLARAQQRYPGSQRIANRLLQLQDDGQQIASIKRSESITR